MIGLTWSQQGEQQCGEGRPGLGCGVPTWACGRPGQAGKHVSAAHQGGGGCLGVPRVAPQLQRGDARTGLFHTGRPRDTLGHSLALARDLETQILFLFFFSLAGGAFCLTSWRNICDMKFNHFDHFYACGCVARCTCTLTCSPPHPEHPAPLHHPKLALCTP